MIGLFTMFVIVATILYVALITVPLILIWYTLTTTFNIIRGQLGV